MHNIGAIRVKEERDWAIQNALVARDAAARMPEPEGCCEDGPDCVCEETSRRG